jgi:methyl-accepting chemotaxis protein
MNWFRNMKIATRLYLLGFVVVAMFLIMTAVGVLVHSVVDIGMKGLVAAGQTDSHLREQVHGWKNLLIRGQDKTAMNKYYQNMLKARRDTSSDFEELKVVFHELELNMTPLTQLQDKLNEMQHAYDLSMPTLRAASGTENYDVTVHKVDKEVRGVDRAVTDLSLVLGDVMQTAIEREVNVIFIIFGVLGIITIVLVFLLVYLIGRTLGSSFNELIAASDQLAAGDLRVKVPDFGRNELGALSHSFNRMTENLAKLIKASKDASGKMFETLDNLKQIINVQVSSATEQASSVNETTSAAQQIKTSSGVTLEKAKELGKSANQTRQEGEKGFESVKKAVGGMNMIKEKVEAIAQSILGLSEHTQQIGETTAAVAGLAQQSKLLSLNASIEAAKAGDAGKGFAVVASEVRNLAEQSQQATTKVQKILQDIQQATDRAVMATEEGSKEVETGLSSINDTGNVIQQLTQVINDTVGATQQIVAALQQEVGGIDQIAEAMQEINKATEQLTKSAKQTEESSTLLSTVFESMKSGISSYKVDYEEK